MEAANPNTRGKWFLLYLACGVMSACSQADYAPSNHTNPVVPTITDIVPATGPLEGGIKVEILGTWFDDPYGDLTVTFGDVQLRPDEIASDRLVVKAPAVTDAGAVPISVHTVYGTVTRDDAFTYEFPADRWGAYAEIALYDVINPNQFDPPLQDSVDGFAAFIEPIEEPLIDGAAPTDTCEFNASSSTSNLDPTPLDVGGSVYMSSGSAGLTLAPDGNGYYAVADAPASSYAVGGLYDLVAGGGAGLDTFSVPDAVQTLGDRLTVSAPNLGFYDATTGYTEVPRNAALAFTWSGTPTDFVQIDVYGFDVDTGQYVNEIITCDVVDDGSFSIPAAQIQKMTTTDILLVYVSRGSFGEFEFTPNATHAQSLAFESLLGVLQFPP